MKKLQHERLVPIHASQRYFEETVLASVFVGTRGLTSSMRMIIPMSCKGPSNCTKLGASSTRIHQV